MSTKNSNEELQQELEQAIKGEGIRFQEHYQWLEENMPSGFFHEVSPEHVMLIVHNLMGFHLQDFFSQIHLKHASIVLCCDSPDADLRILKKYAEYGVKNYKSYVSKRPFDLEGGAEKLRVSTIYFTEAVETGPGQVDGEVIDKLRREVKERNPDVTDDDFDRLTAGINTRFLQSLKADRLALAFDMLFRAKTRDHCQYELRYNEDWKETGAPSLQLVLAWRNTPKYNFLYRMVRVIHRYGLAMRFVNATYVDPYSSKNILVMAIGLHGANGEAAWDVANVKRFLRELVTVKYFGSFDSIEETFVSPGLLDGAMGNLLRTAMNFVHQILVQLDPHRYTLNRIESDLCRHPDLTLKITDAFEYKFDPDKLNLEASQKAMDEFDALVERLDTGHPTNDIRRKNVLVQAMNMVRYTLKTNFYRNNKTAFSFRLDPGYLDKVPYDRTERFPELPFAIFFIKGQHFIGYHIRFKDLARGGLRTIFPEKMEKMEVERDAVFRECYNLAYTQHKKNKDIPEGGAKAVIFLKPYARMKFEADILKKELRNTSCTQEEIEERAERFLEEQQVEYLYHTQRSFVNALLTLINCHPDGVLKAKHVVDYYGKPEYIYLGPDENMHNVTIDWIAERSKKYGYKPGGSFISGKPGCGINHKEYGVTSAGVHVYVHEVLKFLGVDPSNKHFTVKMTGGPDGDVAGNQIYNLYKDWPETAKLLALTDGSGTINDPLGLDLEVLVDLFHKGKPIRDYPAEKLHNGGFLLDLRQKRVQSAIEQQTLCFRKVDGEVQEDWLSGSEMNSLFRNNVHQCKADIFIPAGGRPRTLDEENWTAFLDSNGEPTSKAIVEGANLYLTEGARKKLEEKGVLIIKDSSANKGGVVCSSFEIMCGLTLPEEKFLEIKDTLVSETMARLQGAARKEAVLLLEAHAATGESLTSLSEKVSYKINLFTDQLLAYLEGVELGTDQNSPLLRCFLSYCLETLRENYSKELMKELPDSHKKAIIASHIASQLVYRKGLAWSPTVIDILPLILQDSM